MLVHGFRVGEEAEPTAQAVREGYITLNEGRTPVAAINILPSPASQVVEWDLAGGVTAAKTVFVRFVDLVSMAIYVFLCADFSGCGDGVRLIDLTAVVGGGRVRAV